VNLSNVVRRISTSGLALAALLLPLQALADPGIFPNWTVSEFRPNLQQGGRTNTVAVNPLNQNEMFAASDSGGLFKSEDGGMTWAHVNGLPVIYTQSVAYVPAHPNIVLVSAKVDFKTTNGGGVWRSVDGGMTWAPALLETPNPPSPRSGFEISAAGEEVAVGTSDGVFFSIDAGASWHWSVPFIGRVISVLLTPGQGGQLTHVYAAGPSGVRVGTLFGTQLGSWAHPGNFIGGDTITLHSFGRSALSPNHAYITNGHQLFATEDRGSHWTEIQLLLHGNPTCGGTPFIKTALRNKGAAQFLDLYHGNGCGMDRQGAPVFGGSPAYTGSWAELAVGHFTRDLALYQAEPVLLASNGGLHNTADRGATWTYVGGGSAGYNALQVTSVTGQYVGKTPVELYFTTQDNNIWAVNAAGNETGRETDTAGGFFIEAQPQVMIGAEPQITYAGCGGCQLRVAGRHLQHPTPLQHGLNAVSAPVLIGQGRRIQNVSSGLEVTSDLTSWQPFASFPEHPVGLPKFGSAGSNGSTITYQSYGLPDLTGSLLRIEHSGGIGNVIHPAMGGFGSLALNRTMRYAFHPVYDADRQAGGHLIAADDQTMLQTTTGGELWTEIPGLKAQVLDEGKLRFQASLPDFPLPVPLVTAISFFPGDSSQVLLGTNEGGIYYSSDRGSSWGRIEGSRGATAVTSFFWANLNTVYVSTFGRGLWRLDNHPFAGPEAFEQLCPTCGVASPEGVRPPFDHSALVFGGELLAVRSEKSQLREIFVTPGSSVVFTGDPNDPQLNITVTESDGKGTFEPLPKPPADGWIATGVVFTRDATLVGTVFNASELSLVPPKSDEKGK
jgi:photosystem II stability/assembly factor-like uncharacterized protein